MQPTTSLPNFYKKAIWLVYLPLKSLYNISAFCGWRNKYFGYSLSLIKINFEPQLSMRKTA